MADFDPTTDYPIGTERPDLVRTPGGLGLDDLTLERLRAGLVPEDDFRATPATLRLQAGVARAAGSDQLATNLERAAELSLIPDDIVLEIYTALRPGRSSGAELEEWASRLESDYDAPVSASLIREAAVAYTATDLLR